MGRMDLVTTTPRKPVKQPMVWIVASLLLVLGSWLSGQGLWIHVKAVAAQWLLQNAWAQTLNTQQPAKPWPWADTWPVGRLLVPRHGIDQIILADASGRSLAFGPGLVGNETFPDGEYSLVISGHRDTHFSYVQDLQPGESLIVHMMDDGKITYVIESRTVVDSRTERLLKNQDEATLRLITCYPFDALLPGGPLRYVVTARRVASTIITQTPTSTILGGGSRGIGMIGGDA